jgi:glucose/arabinose dehydrogenase
VALVNRIVAGKNYGYWLITYGIEYTPAKQVGDAIQQKEEMEQPFITGTIRYLQVE